MIEHKIKTTPIKLGQLLLGSPLPDEVEQLSVFGLSIDSRHISEGYVFVAVQGIVTHGKQYISDAVNSGAVAIFVAATGEQIDVTHFKHVPVISVPQLERKLSHIAGQFYGHPSKVLSVVGITGTNGKTTCSQLYAQLMAMAGHNTGVVGTLGYGTCTPNRIASVSSNNNTRMNLTATGMTTPDAISVQAICAELLAMGSRHTVMEVSSHGLHQHRVADIAFDVAILTNLSHDHLDYHGTMDNYANAKSLLFRMPSLRCAIVNMDDDFSKTLIDQIDKKVHIITYSVANSLADIFLSNIRYQADGTKAYLHSKRNTYALSTQLVGQFNLSNLLAVLANFYWLDDSEQSTQYFEQAVDNVPAIKPVPGRMEAINNAVNRQVIVDYAHTPDALKNVLQSVSEYNNATVWCVFGCGGDRDKDKRPIMASIAERYANHVVVTTDNPRNENPEAIIRDICKGFTEKNYHTIVDRKRAIESAITQSKQGDIIIIAGKGHEDYQLIHGQKQHFSDQEAARSVLQKMEASSA